MVTKKEIAEWFDASKKSGSRYLIIVCDSFSYEDYPVAVAPEDDVNERIKQIRRSPMQRIMEVYDLEMDRTEQLRAARVFNFPKPQPPKDETSDPHPAGDSTSS